MKIYASSTGHMTKMVAMPIYKTLLQNQWEDSSDTEFEALRMQVHHNLFRL